MPIPRSYRRRGRYFRDHGDATGATGSLLKRRGQRMGTCPSCNAQRFVAKKAWLRKCRPTCAKCGAYLVPSKSAQKADPVLRSQPGKTKPVRHCELCNGKLRETNPRTVCAPCYESRIRTHPYFLNAPMHYLEPTIIRMIVGFLKTGA